MGWAKVPEWLNISENINFLKKWFREKNGLKKSISWCYSFVLGMILKSAVKVTIKILNGNPYFLLYILIAEVDSFPKYYNKIFFPQVLFEL